MLWGICLSAGLYLACRIVRLIFLGIRNKKLRREIVWKELLLKEAKLKEREKPGKRQVAQKGLKVEKLDDYDRARRDFNRRKALKKHRKVGDE